MCEPTKTVDDWPALIDEWSAHLLHTSQHNRMVIGLGGRLQDLANEMREAAGLEPFDLRSGLREGETLDVPTEAHEAHKTARERYAEAEAWWMGDTLGRPHPGRLSDYLDDTTQTDERG